MDFKLSGIHPDIEARLKRWKEQSLVVREAELRFRKADAMKKSFFAQLLLKEREAAGAKVSVAELEHRVRANPEWIDFTMRTAEAETEYNFQKCDLDIREAAYYAMKDTFKHEGHLDKRGAS